MRPTLVIIWCAALAVAACTQAPKAERRASGALHNVLPVSGRLISGSAPASDAAFAELETMGVRTIISVDGAPPDVGRAHAHGMRYIHIPIGYRGVTDEQRLALARAVRDAPPGGVYLHCHHGLHRGPAAAAAAAVTLGRMSGAQGVAFMERAGTSHAYAGLFECVGEAAAADAATLDAIAADFPGIAPTPGFVQAMVEIQQRLDHLTQIRDASWRVPPDNPDLVPLAEAARLENLLRALIDDPRVGEHPPEFGAGMRRAADAAQRFEDALAAGAPPTDLAGALKRVNDSCKSCHVKYRDN